MFDNKIMIGFIWTFILLLCRIESNKNPTARCDVGNYYETLPLIGEEAAILKLDQIFRGYNLEYNLEGEEEWKDYIKMGEKIKLQKKEVPDVPILGLKTHHLHNIGNSWGTSFIALAQRAEKTYVHYGVLNSNQSAPVINNYISVENFTNTTCFDAVLFSEQDRIVVDCAVHLEQPNTRGFHYQNIFYYFKISDGSLYGTVPNPMYIKFHSITNRKLTFYQDLHHTNTFLIRTYLADGVNDEHAHNTYADVMIATDPMNLEVIEVIDRSFLGLTSLKVADIHVYLGEIYMLDESKGLHRILITEEDNLVWKGFYEAKGYNRFSVYSNNLDDRFELALANSHSVYEIDWSSIDFPQIINKYSLMPGSNIGQIFLNDRFLVVQAASQGDELLFNYTWIFNRGDRTYNRAFKVLSHDTPNTRIDFNMDESYLIVMDDETLTNYALDSANLILRLNKTEDFLDRIMNFRIQAKSVQSTTGEQVGCELILNFTMLEDNNRTIWPTGKAPSSVYQANYPGKVVIPIYDYVLGPNITYKITEVRKGDLQKYGVIQQQQLKVHWQNQPSLQNITFLKSDSFQSEDKQLLMIFLQDSENVSYTGECDVNHEEQDMFCTTTVTEQMEGQLQNWATTFFTSRYTMQQHYVLAYTTKKHHNRVYVRKLREEGEEEMVELGKGYSGNVTGTIVADKYLYVILKYVKKVEVYDLELCLQGLCEAICEINHLKMYQLGVKYFSPESVHTSLFYPDVIFIKTSDTIIAVDVSHQCVPKLLAVIRPVTTVETPFTFLLSLDHLIVTIPPKSIVEYDLSRLYVRDVTSTKHYPLYGYQLPKNYDTDVSEYGKSMFITTVNEAGDYTVLIYRAGYPAVAALYDIIDLYTYHPILIDACGSSIDYVTVHSPEELRIFRQFELPLAQIYNPDKGYQFWLQYANNPIGAKLELIQVNVINLPNNIEVNPWVEDIMNTKDLLFSGPDKVSYLDDSTWYEGNVVRVEADCWDCEQEVKVRNHISTQSTTQVFPLLSDYQWIASGSSILSSHSIIKLYSDAKISQIVQFPQVQESICLKTVMPTFSKYEISGCITGEGVTLYLTSYVSYRGFAFPPYTSRATSLHRLQAAHQLVMVVDAHPMGVILYAVNEDIEEDEALEEVEYIDGSQLGQSVSIHDAQLYYTEQINTYQLYLTENQGLSIIHFNYHSDMTGITVVQSQRVNIVSLLAQHKVVMPYDATFDALTVAQSIYDSTLKQTNHSIIITTTLYHTLEVHVIYDEQLNILSVELGKMYLRYAYYTVQSELKHYKGYILLNQILPAEFDNITQSQLRNHRQVKKAKQLLSLYERGKGEELEVGLKGAYQVWDDRHYNFGFNLTDRDDRVGLVLIQQADNKYNQLSVHANLSVETKETVDTQIINLKLISGFDEKKIRILLNGYAPFPEWKLIMIILFSIIGFFILAAAGFFIFKLIRRRQIQDRQSLLTSQT